MRHRMGHRHFGRMPNHRKAMFRNLATNLITHERIYTSLAKAKEMRPLIERLIHKAKKNDSQSHIFIKSTLFTKVAIEKLKKTIAPRFKDLPAGFTRVQFMGPREVDKGKSAMIEILKNPFSEFEKNEELVECEQNGMKTFWEWEHGILEQEEKYWEDHLRQLKKSIEQEVQQVIAKEAGCNEARQLEIRSDINGKYQQQKLLLVRGWQRTKDEIECHLKQKNYKKYQRLFHQYAYPLMSAKFTSNTEETMKQNIQL